MTNLSVLTVVGTRPEIIRLSRVIMALDDSPAINHTLVHTGQNYDYELNQIFFDELGLRKPDYFLEAAGKNASETIGNILIKIDALLAEIRPEALLILGDTNSCLCAIPAKKRQIPIFHMEAGNRCFDQRVPEETNRRIVDHIADVNLTYSSIAREYLLREGLPADRIIKTGSPMYEVLNHYQEPIRTSQILSDLGLEKKRFFVVSAHREENIANLNSFTQLIGSLNSVAEVFGHPIIFSTHPRTRKQLESTKLETHELIKFIKPLGFSDYNALQLSAFCVLSDSGTISEESSILGFPALNIREAHERPEAMEEASVPMVGLNTERILQGISELASSKSSSTESYLVEDYSKPNVSSKVVKIILSYTDYVQRVVYHNPN